MICSYCGEDKKLIKAHIIPEAFFKRLRDGKQEPSPLLLTNKNDVYPKRSPIGIYDCNILCLECEKQFGDWDNYAQELLREKSGNASPIMVAGKCEGYEVRKYNYTYLKLFFISLLWRAAVSKDHFYAKVNLGAHEAIAKDLIARRSPGSEDDFSIILAKFDHSGKILLDPHPEKYGGVNYYRFYIGSYVAYIKTDKRKAQNSFSEVMMKPEKPLLIVGRDFARSKEFFLIKKIAMMPKNKRQSKKP